VGGVVGEHCICIQAAIAVLALHFKGAFLGLAFGVLAAEFGTIRLRSMNFGCALAVQTSQWQR
jgi:hypothetical protein